MQESEREREKERRGGLGGEGRVRRGLASRVDHEFEGVEEVGEAEDEGSARSVGEDGSVVGDAAIQHPHVAVFLHQAGEGEERDGGGCETGFEEVLVGGELGDHVIPQPSPPSHLCDGDE